MVEFPKFQRHMPEQTKQKISKKMAGVKKTEVHKEHISQGLVRAWAKVPKDEE